MRDTTVSDGADRPAVSVCVPVWKVHGRPNLASLGEGLPTALGQLHGELVVVLNGVRRGQIDMPPQSTVIELRENVGVPAAWNLAARVATGDVLCFTNDDVLLGDGAIASLTAALRRHPDAGVVGPVGTHWDLRQARHVDYVSTAGMAAGAVTPCDVVSGFLFATPAATFWESGGFDEAYSPCGFEEVDYCTSVRRLLGKQCYAVAGISQSHEFGISSRRSWRRVRWRGGVESLGSIARRNRAHFLAKWSDFPRES